MAVRLPWILAALALGLVALGWFLGRTDAPRAPAARQGAAAREPDQVAVELREVSALTAERPDEGARAPAAAEAPAPLQPAFGALLAPPVERLLVRGTVWGAGVDLERVELVLRQVGRPSQQVLRGACDAEGRYELDVTDLIDTSMLRMHHTVLELAATHPDCLRERRRIELQRGVSPAVVPGTQYVQWREGTTVCEVDVELLQAGFVRGLLVGVEDPFDFAVVAAELREGRPVQPWLAHAMLDAQGRFELRLAPNASYLVVAAARTTRPTAVRVDLLAPGAREVVIQPERGVELSGRVRIAPGFPEREVGVELQFARREDDEPPELWPGPGATLDRMVWLDGAFEWRLRRQRTHDGGSFTFTGLAPREYELRALAVGVPGVELRAWPVARLRAPGEGFEFGPVLASLEIDLGPLPDGPIAFELVEEQEHSISLVSTLSLGPYRTDSQGRAQVHLPPGRAYRVLVAGETVGRIASPAAGEFARFALAR